MMSRSAFLTASAGAIAAAALPRAAQAADTDIALDTASGRIFGTLMMPASSSVAVPVTLIIAGSGPTDRNGNNPLLPGANDAYKLLAAALADKGVASVRYDKRGIAASAKAGSSENDLRFDTYIDDAVGWMKLLRADSRFSKLVVAGHSEGSLVGIVACEHAQCDAFVSLEGAGRPAPVILREQLERQLPPDLYTQADAILTGLQAGKTTDVPSTSPLASIFRSSVQPYLISWFKYDPASEIAKLRMPVTVVQGSADIQVSMTDAQALAKAAHNARFVSIDGMNHVLKHAPDTSSQAAVMAGYGNPKLPVEPKVIDAIATATSA